jgi:hypothetical protein
MKKILWLIVGSVLVWSTEVADIFTAKEVGKNSEGLYFKEKTERYAPDAAVFNIVAHLTDVNAPTTIRVEWYAIDAISQPNYLIAVQDFNLTASQNQYLHAFMQRGPNLWPVGHYKVLLREKGKVIGETHFEVQRMQPAEKNVMNQKGKNIAFIRFATEVTKDASDNVVAMKEATTIPSDATFYVVLRYKDMVPQSDTLLMRWYFKPNEEASWQPLFEDGPAYFVKKEGTISGKVELKGAHWPEGIYRVDVFVNGNKAKEGMFRIVKGG